MSGTEYSSKGFCLGLAIDRFRGLEKILLLSMFMVGLIRYSSINHAFTHSTSSRGYSSLWWWLGLGWITSYVTGAAYPGREGQATAISGMGVSSRGSCRPLIFGFVFTTLGSNVAWFLMSIAGILACI
ncbi:MFS transporter OS=Lysinibacillus sphaericus OX=1421 GN=LS41612_21310 PE=4 SV=1 [Lysinibacillus sphaericus]